LKAYRLWKSGTKVIVKARDVKIFEDTDRQDELSKEILYVSYLNIDDIETKDNHESATEDDGEVVDEGDAESSDPDDNSNEESRKGSSCPFKDGKAG